METELVKVLSLKYPTISYTNKLYEGNKNFTSQNAKIASQNQKNFSPAGGYKPHFAREIIAKLLFDDNSNAALTTQKIKI